MLEAFAALAEPSRLRIVELLRHGPRSVNDIGLRLRLNQPQVSKHLRVLKAAGLVSVATCAQRRIYELRSRGFREFDDWLASYRGLWNEPHATVHAAKESPHATVHAAKESPHATVHAAKESPHAMSAPPHGTAGGYGRRRRS